MVHQLVFKDSSIAPHSEPINTFHTPKILFFWDTLTEVFPCFFLSCKATARVKPAKTGHGPHSPWFLCCSMYCLFCVVLCIVCVYMCTVLLPPGGYPIAVKYIISYHISYHIISYHIISYHIIYHIISYIVSYHISYHLILSSDIRLGY